MRIPFLLVCEMLLVGIANLPANGQWVQMSAPAGGQVNSITPYGTSVYVGIFNGSGLIRSTNSGASWTALNPDWVGRSYVSAVAVTPNGSGGTNLFAAVGAVYRSTDNGTTWSEANNGTSWHSLDLLAARVRGTDSVELFAGGYGVVFRSSDNGENWEEADAGLPQNSSLTFLSVSGTYIFVGTDDGDGLYRSSDDGNTWTYIGSGLSSNIVPSSFAAVPHDSGSADLFLGSLNPYIFRSSDNGLTWMNVSSGLPSSDYIRCIVADTSTPGATTLYAAVGYQGVYRSTNSGSTWTAAGTGIPGGAFVDALGLCPNLSGGEDLFSGTMEYGIFRSTNGGTTWAPANGGALVVPVNCILMNGTNLYVGSCEGVHLSTDNGVSWVLINSGLTSTCVDAVAVSSTGGTNYLYAGTGSGLFRSTNNGTQWFEKDNGLPHGTITSIAAGQNGSGGSALFAGATGNGVHGVYRSTDSGENWALANVGIPSGVDVQSLAAAGGIVFASISAWPGGFVYRSRDNGLTWDEADFGLNVNDDVNSFAFGTNDSGREYVYAATEAGYAYRSADTGTSWTEADAGMPVGNGRATILAVPNTNGVPNLFATGWGIEDGVYLSTDNGVSWGAVNEGFPIFPATYNLAYGPTTGGAGTQYLFAGSAFREISGVWRRPLSEFRLPPFYNIVAAAGAHGSIVPSGTILVDSGGTQDFAITPDGGYQVDSLIIDGALSGSTTYYSFDNINANHSIRVTFARNGIDLPPWTYTNTGMNHTILIDTSVHPTVNGVPLDSGDFIGVFYDYYGSPACGGYGMWTGRGAIAIAAFGNELGDQDKNGFNPGEVFQWKIYRYFENQVYDAAATYYVPDSINHLTSTNTYVTDGISRLHFLNGGAQSGSITLRKGWSMISSYISPASTDLDTLFNSVRSDLVILKNGKGKAYIPWVPINSIGSWDNMQGYQLKMDSERTLPVSGTRINPESTPVNIASGWSLIPYFRQSALGVDTALSSLADVLVIAKDQDGNAYIPSIPVNSIGNMEPGEGYQVKLSGNGTLLYPMNTSLLSKRVAQARHSRAGTFKNHYVLKSRTDNNATIVFTKKAIGGILMKGDEVGVFDEQGMLVGSGVYEGENFAIAAWGDDATTVDKDGLKPGEQFSVRFWYAKSSSEHAAKTIEWTEGGSAYEVDGINVVERVQVDLADMPIPDRVELYQNYPNPFNPSTTIRFSIPNGMNVRIRVYNVLGEEVAEVANSRFETGYHELTFNSGSLASGVYYCRIEAGRSIDVKKMVVMK
ncbi:MAG TPA: T9SS type A sorting domain-containing protein [Bacteroidota bacterium]|nr:T9SS type A sorting domain-containing protein [Bacteroidota bacterium]